MVATETRSEEVTRIVQALAGLPGSSAVHVISKRFPHLGPAESGSMYEEKRRRFPADSIPTEGVAMPADVEEIIITLEGRLPGPEIEDELVQRVSSLLGETPGKHNWDMRARFEKGRESLPYEFIVFTSQPVRIAGSFD